MQSCFRRLARLLIRGGFIEWAADSGAAAGEDVGIDHCCSHVRMAEKFLDVADIIALFEEVRCEGVAECVAAAILRNSSAEDSGFDCALEGALINVMTAFEAGRLIEAATGRGKEELPAKLLCGIGVFAFE